MSGVSCSRIAVGEGAALAVVDSPGVAAGLGERLRDGPVELRPPGPRGGGYGFFLVERLTDQWGVEMRDGTMVWAELSGGPAR